MAQQHVILAVAAEITDANKAPFPILGKINHAAASQQIAAIHGEIPPTAILVAQQHVVLAVAVEVAELQN